MFPRISETFILREVLALKRQGIPVRIYSVLPPTRDAKLHPQAAALLEEVCILPQPRLAEMGGFLRDLRGCFAARPWPTVKQVLRLLLRPQRSRFRKFFRAVCLVARMREDRVAHLHAAWAHTPASVARIASRLAGVPWSMGGHAKDIYLSNPESLARKMEDARFTTVCSDFARNYLGAIAGSPQEEIAAPVIELHYHGVDTDYFSPSPAASARADEDDLPLLLSVGRLVPKKGHEILLDAAALLKSRGHDFRLELIGEGPLRADLEKRVDDLNLGDRVVLRGMLVMDHVRDRYRRAACVALASQVTSDGDRDGIPNTLAEAMACGVPVVATELPSIRELITDEKDGLLVPPGDAGMLADALARLLVEPLLHARLAKAGRDRVLEFFDAEEWGTCIAKRFHGLRGVDSLLYLSADRGVPVQGHKGASVHVRSAVKALRGLGVDVRVLTARRGPKDGTQAGVPVIERSTSPRVKRSVGRLANLLRGGAPLEKAILRVLDNLPLYREGLRQVRARRPDMIYERYALTAVAGSLLARRIGVPHVVEVNAPLAEEERRFRELRLGVIARFAESWILRRADRVVVVSEALAGHCRGLGVAPERILVLPNAVDPELFHPGLDGSAVRERYDLNGKFVVGFSGTLRPWHGMEHLLRAVASLKEGSPDLRLLVVGDGPDRGQVELLATELGLDGRVHFAGAVKHDEVGSHLAACDLLTAPYGPMDDHWFSPLKVAEYLAVGRPVVASAIGQLRSLDESAGALLVPPGNEQKLAEAIARLAEDPGLRSALGERAAAGQTWTWRELIRRMLTASEESRRQIWRWSA